MRRLILAVALGLAACGGGPRDADPTPTRASGALPETKWDFHPEGSAWTEASLRALGGHGVALVALTPRDIATWCPAYPDAGPEQRKAFWVGLASALAEYESTWNPRAIGGGGRWFGLLQISPATARGYGCAAGSGEALLDGPANLSCAIRIWAETVPRDGVVADGGGVAADWGPMTRSGPRTDMAAWTRSQSYCRG